LTADALVIGAWQRWCAAFSLQGNKQVLVQTMLFISPCPGERGLAAATGRLASLLLLGAALPAEHAGGSKQTSLEEGSD